MGMRKTLGGASQMRWTDCFLFFFGIFFMPLIHQTEYIDTKNHFCTIRDSPPTPWTHILLQLFCLSFHQFSSYKICTERLLVIVLDSLQTSTTFTRKKTVCFNQQFEVVLFFNFTWTKSIPSCFILHLVCLFNIQLHLILTISFDTNLWPNYVIKSGGLFYSVSLNINIYPSNAHSIAQTCWLNS